MIRDVWACSIVLVLGSASIAAEGLPPIESATYDAAGRFVVNGQPFFPILLYDCPKDDAMLAELRDFGFNVLTCRPEEHIGLAARSFYGAVHAGKKPIEEQSNVLFAMGTDSPALYYKKDLLGQTAEANAKVAAAIPNRPLMNAIGYWEDEPTGVVAGKLPSKAVYEDLVAAIDVSAPYLYPVPYQPVSSVGDAVARARAATGGQKPILPILQLFAWTPEARYPTPAELRCMVFLALVEGAHGIGYYSFGHVTGRPKTTLAEAQPELWRSVKQLNHDVAKVGRRLLIGTPVHQDPNADFTTTPVRFRYVRDAQGVLIVVVNPTDERQKVDPKRTDGVLRTLEPFEVRIIELDAR